MMPSFIDWPFFDDHHRALLAEVDRWAAAELPRFPAERDIDVDAACRARVRALGAAGLLQFCVPAAHGGRLPTVESRALALIRERLAYHDALADFSFAMQGLGSGAITLAGSDAQRAQWLPQVAAGRSIAAFALSEAGAGSDVAALECRAQRVGDGWQLDGEKTWISNGGIADFYVVFARSAGSARSSRGITAFVVPATAAGLNADRRIETLAPHPLATVRFDGCRLPESAQLGAAGDGFALAMATLDIFRASVAGAALGMAQRALDEALTHVRQRELFGTTLAQMQLTQATLADAATELDAARLLTYRAGWLRDVRGEPTTQAAAMAKMAATESAQRVIDTALQLFGARGVQAGSVPERLYREIRALRIYEGATEVQKLVIARELLRAQA